MEIGRYPEEVADHPLTPGALRLAANIPVPGINHTVLQQIAAGGGAAGNLFGLLDLLSGGTVSRFLSWRWECIHTLPLNHPSTAGPD